MIIRKCTRRVGSQRQNGSAVVHLAAGEKILLHISSVEVLCAATKAAKQMRLEFAQKGQKWMPLWQVQLHSLVQVWCGVVAERVLGKAGVSTVEHFTAQQIMHL